jgi:hypothetical protein
VDIEGGARFASRPSKPSIGNDPGVFNRGFDDVRAATTHDLGALADEVVDVTDTLELSDDEPAQALLTEAVASFERAERKFDDAEEPNDFAEVTAAIGRGRFLLACARARLDGTSLPVEQPCFFDPRHGPAERLVAWTPPQGEPRTVPACDVDAELVEANAQPEPRKVAIDERLVPYWDAPEHFGPWFSGYFESVEGCAAADLLAGMRLGEFFLDTPEPASGPAVVSRAEIRERWLGLDWPEEDEDE